MIIGSRLVAAVVAVIAASVVYSLLAYGTKVRGFKPGRSRQIFRAKKSSARLPSEGKESRRSHVADLRHAKDP